MINIRLKTNPQTTQKKQLRTLTYMVTVLSTKYQRINAEYLQVLNIVRSQPGPKCLDCLTGCGKYIFLCSECQGGYCQQCVNNNLILSDGSYYCHQCYDQVLNNLASLCNSSEHIQTFKLVVIQLYREIQITRSKVDLTTNRLIQAGCRLCNSCHTLIDVHNQPYYKSTDVGCSVFCWECLTGNNGEI